MMQMIEKRYAKVWQVMEEKGVEILIITHPTNVLYLSGFGTLLGRGFAPFGGVLIVPYKSSPTLIVPWIEYEVAQRESFLEKIYYFTPYPIYIANKFTQAQRREELIAQIIKETCNNKTTIGIEKSFISAASYGVLKSLLTNCQFVDVSGLIEAIRSVKTEEELILIRRAAEIATLAMREVLSLIKPNVAETTIAQRMASTIYENAAQFSHIVVASGERSIMPHGLPTARKLKNGDLVVIDFGVLYQGYWAELCRTFAVGDVRMRQQQIFNLVKEAQARAAETLRPGVKASVVDAAAREFFIERGYGEFFIHSSGHGLGLGEGDAPFIAPGSDELIQSNMAISLEPGLYLNHENIGIRLEDAFLVQESRVERLTSLPQTLQPCE